MTQKLEIVTAETAQGRQAIAEVMERSYGAEIGSVSPAWARALIADGTPVSFILVDPERRMAYPGDDLLYAFILDVATRKDRRGEGHFRYIMEHTFENLRAAGCSLVVTHGRYQLYRRFGFDVFTHHSGIFVTPEQVERALGIDTLEPGEQVLTIEERPFIHEDLLLVTAAQAETVAEAKIALQAAAALAQEKGKARILFEHPSAPSYGSRYPIYSSLETPLTALARACGAEVRFQGADPETGTVPDADWIKVLDTANLLREAVASCKKSLPPASVTVKNDAGAATIEGTEIGVTVSKGIAPGAAQVGWPSSALGQLVTGYCSAEMLCASYGTPLPAETMALLDVLFPQRWRLSRNESWTFKS